MAVYGMTEEEVRKLDSANPHDKSDLVSMMLLRYGIDPEKPWEIKTTVTDTKAEGMIRTGRNMGRRQRNIQ